MDESPWQPEKPASAPISENDRLLAGLCYISQLFVPAVLPIVLLVGHDTQNRDFLRYHSIQSLASLVVVIIYYLAATLLYAIAAAISGCLLCLFWVLFLPPIAVLGYYGWHAYRGEWVEIPWLTQFLRDNKWL